MGVILCVFYLFALIGMEMFGGKVYQQNFHIYSDPNLPTDYIFNNFNDFGGGLMTLFELMVVNNWQVITTLFTDTTSNYVRWYFVMFYILAAVISLNLMVAFVIDMFNS